METGKSGASKLTKERVKVIQSLFQFEDIKDGDIAKLFNVSRESINHIRHGHRWSDVTGINNFNKEIDRQIRSNDFRQFTSKPNEKNIMEIVKQSLEGIIAKL